MGRALGVDVPEQGRGKRDDEKSTSPDSGRYLWDFPQPYTRQSAEAFVQMAAALEWDSEARFAMEFEGKAIGGIHLYVTDTASRVAGLGYNVARTHWRKGFTTEAASAVLRFAFETVSLHKIYSRADSRNVGSLAVMRKLGMTQEASLRKHRFYRGDWMDEVWCSILRQEWLATRQTLT